MSCIFICPWFTEVNLSQPVDVNLILRKITEMLENAYVQERMSLGLVGFLYELEY